MHVLYREFLQAIVSQICQMCLDSVNSFIFRLLFTCALQKWSFFTHFCWFRVICIIFHPFNLKYKFFFSEGTAPLEVLVPIVIQVLYHIYCVPPSKMLKCINELLWYDSWAINPLKMIFLLSVLCQRTNPGIGSPCDRKQGISAPPQKKGCVSSKKFKKIKLCWSNWLDGWNC